MVCNKKEGQYQMNKRKAFTIIELLTSLVIIALLLTLLLPSIAMIRRMAKETAQKAQFSTIDMALDAFKQDYGDYPSSNTLEGDGIVPPSRFYCGTQKLTEALLGWDLMGFDPNSVWRRDGRTGTLIPGGPDSYDPLRVRGNATLYERRGPYLEVAKTSVFRLGMSVGKEDGLYDLSRNPNPFDATLQNYVICDVFGVKKITFIKPGPNGETIVTTAGSPILYYKANTSYKAIDCNVAGALKSIYNLNDNIQLLNLGILPKPDPVNRSHQLIKPGTSGRYFCDPQYKIIDEKVYSATGQMWPHRPDSYLLISAGMDHEFGTSDDILNF
jgi:prepilin-type N-terminal cleavage/methylation domain-containing protein